MGFSKNKKSVSSIILYLIFTVILSTFFIFTFNYSEDIKEENFILKKTSLLKKITYDIRTNLVSFSKYEKSNFTFKHNYKVDGKIYFYKNKSKIEFMLLKTKKINSIEFFGINFCKDYEILVKNKMNFVYNNSCYNFIN